MFSVELAALIDSADEDSDGDAGDAEDSDVCWLQPESLVNVSAVDASKVLFFDSKLVILSDEESVNSEVANEGPLESAVDMDSIDGHDNLFDAAEDDSEDVSSDKL